MTRQAVERLCPIFVRALRGAATVLVLAGLSSVARAQLVMYVDDDAAPGGVGLTWATAHRHLQDALAVAPDNTEIRIAAGRHKPDEGSGQILHNVFSTFRLDRRLTLKGGYRGLAGGGLPQDRDLQQFVTELHGDLRLDAPANGDNALHIVTVATSSVATLDGLRIVDGGGTGISVQPPQTAAGGGVLLTSGTLRCVDVDFRNCHSLRGPAMYAGGGTLDALRCTFEGATTTANNGAVYLQGVQARFEACRFERCTSALGGSLGGALTSMATNLTLVGCEFLANVTVDAGGALYAEFGSTVARDTLFDSNSAQVGSGGAIFTRAAPLTLLRCTVRRSQTNSTNGSAVLVQNAFLTADDSLFEENQTGGSSALAPGGGFTITRSRFLRNVALGLGSGGALSLSGPGTLSQCSFVGNRATYGGAVRWEVAQPGVGIIDRCSFLANHATSQGGAVFFSQLVPGTLRNSIVWGNTAGPLSSLNSQVFGEFVAPTVTYSDIQGLPFAGPGNLNVDPLFLSVSSNDLRLAAGSPCIDAGDPALSDPDGSRLDMGAWPYEPGACPALATYCSPSATNPCATTLSWQGNPSATVATPFVIVASSVQGARQGLFFYGIRAPLSVPFGQGVGTRCVASPIQRTSPQLTGGTSGSCDGTLTLDWNAYLVSNPSTLGAPFSLGDTVWMQAWLREPSGAGPMHLTDALQFSHCY